MGRPDKSTQEPKRRRVSLGRVVLVAVILACLAGLWVVWQWRRKPPCWSEHDRLQQMSAETLDRMAEQIERRTLREVSQIGRVGGDGDTATVEFPFDQTNAWLMVRMKDWALHQSVSLPKPLGDLVVASDGDKPVVAFELKTEEVDQVFSIGFDVRLPAPGKVTASIDSVHAGRLPIPVGAVLEHLRKSVPRDAIEPMAKLLAGETFDAVFDHPGHEGKRLRVVGFEVKPDAVAVTLEAEPR